MAEYRGIKGFTIQSIAGDPSNPVEGQVWYNTTTTVLKGYKLTPGTGAWASGGTVNQTRGRPGGAGIQTAGLITGGSTGAPWVFYTNTETYNGTAWTEVNDLNTGRGLKNGAGTQTAALIAGGFSYDLSPNFSALTEKYDGTSWTEAGDLTTPRGMNGGNGTQTAALNSGGEGTPGSLNVSEEWDGTSWSEGNNLNTGRGQTAGSGTQTDGLVISGVAPPAINAVESYNGTCYSAVANIGTGRYCGGTTSGAASSGSLFFAGRPPTSGTALTESWDGSTWTEVADQATATNQPGSFGTTILAVRAAGNTSPSATTATSEEWTVPQPIETKTFTAT